jgi:CHAT domain-containing protein
MLRLWRWAALALVALGAAYLLNTGSQDPRGEASDANSPYNWALASLAAEPRAGRPLEARVSGGFPHARYKSGCKDSRSLRAGAGQEARGGSSPSDLGAAAVVDLLDCHPEKAINLLEQALAASSRDPRLLSDLAAAHLQRGDLESSPYDIVQALTVADRSLKLSPSFPEARFNRALALTRLGLAQEAEKAWREYLDLDKNPGWQEEASAYLQKLQEPREVDLWKVDRDRLDQAALRDDSAAVRRIVTTYRQAARLYVEDNLLGDWALAQLQGHEGESRRSLAIAWAVAEALESPMLRAEVGAAEEALRSPAGPRLAALTRGHALYAKARELHEQQKYPEAEPLFQRAAAALERAHSPFAAWPRFYLAVITYHHGDRPKAIQSLEDLRHRFAAWGSPVLQGYIDWIIGQARGEQGPLAAGLAATDAARQSFEQAGEVENQAAMDTTLAQIYTDLGDFKQAWSHHYAALQALPRLYKPRRIENTLSCVIYCLRKTRDLAPAAYFQELLVDEALRTGNPIGVTIALRDRAGLLHELGFARNALAELEKAWKASLGIGDPRLRRSVEVDNLLSQGRILRGIGSADGALKALDQALTLSLQEGNRHRLIETFQERAETWLTLGREREAEADQEAGLAELERQRRTLGDGTLRVFFADQGRALLEERIALQQRRGESAETILDTVEQLRARALLDAVGGPGSAGWPEPRPAHDLAVALPADTVLVEYLWVRNGLLAWTVTRDGVNLVDLELERRPVEELVDRFVGDLKKGRDASADSRELHRLLIAPLEPRLRGASTLIVVPDGALCRLPFAALQEEATSRFLIEDYALAAAPSASVYVALGERYRERSRSAPASILLLGQPEIDPGLASTLTSLPSAEKEIEALRRAYRQPLVLTGPAATAERFLAALPEEDVFHYAGHTVTPRGADAPSLLLTNSAATRSLGGLLPAAGISCPRPPRTRVAVLAGCRTAEGRLSQNEGTLGLARAFLAAGVPVVVASHWDTNDDPSANLLLRFHDLLRAGVDPLTALRQAQLDLLRGPDRHLASPHTWADFQVTGGAFVPVNDLSPPPAASPQSR